MNRALVFEWYKRFKEGKKSLRDGERCGRSKDVNTPELIGQIKNFMDKDRRVFIETINAQFDVSVETVHTIIREEVKIRKICAKFVPRVVSEDQKERRCHASRGMTELINSDPAVLDVLVTCDESWIYCYDTETKKLSSQEKHAGSFNLLIDQLELMIINSRIRLHYMFVFSTFTSHPDWSNAQSVSALANTIPAITVCIYHGLKYFSKMICALQTSTNQNILKLLTQPIKTTKTNCEEIDQYTLWENSL